MMLNDLREFYTDKLLLFYRYKKNLLFPDDLEKEIFNLYCLYKIHNFVKEDNWASYMKLVQQAIGTYCIEVEGEVVQQVSPDEELEVEWRWENGDLCVEETHEVCIESDYAGQVDYCVYGDFAGEEETTTQQTSTQQQGQTSTIQPTTTRRATSTIQQTTTLQQSTVQQTTTIQSTVSLSDVFDVPLGGTQLLALEDLFGIGLGTHYVETI